MNLSNNEGSITPLSNDSENTDIEEDNNDEITGNFFTKLIISENQRLRGWRRKIIISITMPGFIIFVLQFGSFYKPGHRESRFVMNLLSIGIYMYKDYFLKIKKTLQVNLSYVWECSFQRLIQTIWINHTYLRLFLK